VIQEEVIIPLTYFPRESELELLLRGDVAIVHPKTAAFEPEDTAVAAERDAFLRLHPELWAQYPEQYMAIHGGKLVDHDPDMGALLKRIDAHISFKIGA
jgi:hypothetical protein